MRDNRFDNLKAFLIFSVVLCHLFELFPGTLKYRIYIFIYAFHMPLFIFISGYFAKFNIKNILTKLLYPYVIFQVIYCLFTGNRVQFLTPHWILWYLMCLILWSLTFKIADFKPFVLLIISVGISIFAGYFEQIGKPLSLARFFSFYPFFLMGYIAKKNNLLAFEFKGKKVVGILILVVSFLLTKAILPYIKTSWFYHSESYLSSGETPVWRFILTTIAVLWCVGFLFIAPKKKMPCITEIGQYSISIFLIHGLVVQGFKIYRNPFAFSENMNLIFALLVSAVLCFALGNGFVFKLLSHLFVFPLQNAKNVVQYIVNKKRPR